MTNTRTTGPHSPLAVGALAGPALIAAGTMLDRAGGPPVSAYLGHVAAEPGIYLASGMLLFFGMLLLPLTAVGVYRAATGQRHAAVMRIGAIAIVAWGALGTAGVGLGYTAGWVAVDLVGTVPDAVVEQVFTGITYSPWGMIGGGAGGLAWAVGVVATGIGVLLARGLPRWSGIVILCSLVAPLVGGMLGVNWAGSIGFLLLTAGIAGLLPAIRGGRGIPDPTTAETAMVSESRA